MINRYFQNNLSACSFSPENAVLRQWILDFKQKAVIMTITVRERCLVNSQLDV